MKNAEAYSLRQAKLDSPPRNCTAELSDSARKKAKLKQKMLKVKTRFPQSERRPVKGWSRAASSASL